MTLLCYTVRLTLSTVKFCQCTGWNCSVLHVISLILFSCSTLSKVFTTAGDSLHLVVLLWMKWGRWWMQDRYRTGCLKFMIFEKQGLCDFFYLLCTRSGPWWRRPSASLRFPRPWIRWRWVTLEERLWSRSVERDMTRSTDTRKHFSARLLSKLNDSNLNLWRVSFL